MGGIILPMRNVNWHNPHAACAEYKRLDAKFNTDPKDPMHHDQRCGLNHDGPLFQVVAR